MEGSVEKAMAGEVVPTMIPGQSYWKDAYLPAGVCTVITPMNFVYGIPAIQMVGCYLSGSPMIFKGHPFSAMSSTTLVKMLLAAGANPRAVHKIEGFGGDIRPLVADERVAVVSVTGSVETAKTLQLLRGVRPVRFEGGGCNWAWIDDGFADSELDRIATRLAYSKLGLGSHKCTSLHGVAASRGTLDRLEPKIVAEMKTWRVDDPRSVSAGETKVVGPVMVHKASTVTSIQERARAAGIDDAAIAAALRTFPGVSHRLELIGERNGVRFVNDSKATNVAAARRALAAYADETVHLILGGSYKGEDFGPLAAAIGPNVRSVHLIGEEAARLAEVIDGHRDGTLERAFAHATELAQAGDVVLLSPAAASYDQFANFEERGEAFRNLVRS